MFTIKDNLFANFCSIVTDTFASNHNSAGTYFSAFTETNLEKEKKQLAEQQSKNKTKTIHYFRGSFD